MRTSTIVFLVLFLAVFSSDKHKERIHGAAMHVRDAVRELAGSRHACRPSQRAGAAEDSPESRELRDRLREVEQRDGAADKSLRALDRALRAVEDRLQKLRREAATDPDLADVFAGGLALLARQQVELRAERAQIQDLQEQFKAEAIRLQTELDLASIRGERRAAEEFLLRERGSPTDRLAEAVGAR